MNDNLISIIVPVYNVEKYLRRCVDSLINQTYHNLEIILVDDGSPDNCGKICDSYAKQDKRISVTHKKNEGVTKARISGYLISKGDFITFVDADDYIAPDTIEVFVKSQQKSNADVVVGNINEVNGDKIFSRGTLRSHFYNKQEIEKHLQSSFLYDSHICMAGIPLYLSGKLFCRSVLKNALEKGLDIWYEEDLVSVVYVLYNIESLQVIDDGLYFYVMHEGQVTRKNPLDIALQMEKARERIRSFDTREILKDQLLFRCYGNLKDILSKLYRNDMPFPVFREFFRKSRMTTEMQDFFKSSYLPIRLTDKIAYNLLKYNQSRTYFLFLYIRGKLKNI